METFILALASLVILVPLLYFLPLGLSVQGKFIIILIAFFLAIIGLLTSFVYSLWVTGLVMLSLVMLTTIILNVKLKKFLYLSGSTEENQLKLSNEAETGKSILLNDEYEAHKVVEGFSKSSESASLEESLLETDSDLSNIETDPQITEENKVESIENEEDDPLKETETMEELEDEGMAHFETAFNEAAASIDLDGKAFEDSFEEESVNREDQDTVPMELEEDLDENAREEPDSMEEDIFVESILEADALEEDTFEESIPEAGSMEEGNSEASVLEESKMEKDSTEAPILETDIFDESILESDDLEEDIFEESILEAESRGEDNSEVSVLEESNIVEDTTEVQVFKADIFEAEIRGEMSEESVPQMDSLEGERLGENSDGADEPAKESFKAEYRTALQQQMFHTMISQLSLARKQMSPSKYEQLIKEHLHPSLPANDYYTFASLLIEHYIRRNELVKLNELLADLKGKFKEYPILIMEIQYLYEQYC